MEMEGSPAAAGFRRGLSSDCEPTGTVPPAPSGATVSSVKGPSGVAPGAGLLRRGLSNLPEASASAEFSAVTTATVTAAAVTKAPQSWQSPHPTSSYTGAADSTPGAEASAAAALLRGSSMARGQGGGAASGPMRAPQPHPEAAYPVAASGSWPEKKGLPPRVPHGPSPAPSHASIGTLSSFHPDHPSVAHSQQYQHQLPPHSLPLQFQAPAHTYSSHYQQQQNRPLPAPSRLTQPHPSAPSPAMPHQPLPPSTTLSRVGSTGHVGTPALAKLDGPRQREGMMR